MNVLILGGGGFLGMNLAKAMSASGIGVVIADSDCDSARRHLSLLDGIEYHNILIGDVDTLVNLIAERRIKCVVNLVSTILPSSDVNAFLYEIEMADMPALRLMHKLAERKIKYVFLSSGGAVYGNTEVDKVGENASCKPISFYGQNKVFMEDCVRLMNRMHGLEYLLLRPSNPYGRFQRPEGKQGFVCVALDRVIRGLPVEIWGDGHVVRDYIHVDDLAGACVSLISNGVSNDVFNIGSGAGYSLNQVLACLGEITGKPVEVLYKAGRPVDVQHLVLDVEKIKSVIDFNPVSLGDGIGNYYASLVGHNA